ncbi:MAG: pilus assembly protein PilM [Candidatus Omnitrophota bacterium]
MKNNILTAIEITDSHIKLLQAMVRRASPVIMYCGSKEISQYPESEIPRLLSSFVNEAKISPDQLTVIIPRRLVMLRHFSLPSHSEAEIEKMIGLQLVKQVPYSKEDIVSDHIILEREPSGYSKVLVVIAHKEVTHKYLKIFSEARLNLNKLTLSSEGLLHWYLFEDAKRKQKTSQPVALINIDTVNTEICFCHRQQLLFSRSINYGAKDLTEEHIPALMEEINLTMATYAKERIGDEVGKMILISAMDRASLLQDQLKTEYKMNIETISPFLNVLQKKDLNAVSLLAQSGISMAATIGLTLAGSRKLINLLPTEVSDKREVKRQKQESLKFLVLLGLLFVLAVLIFAGKLYKNQIYLNTLERQHNEIKPIVNKVNEKIKQLNFIKEQLNPKATAVDIVYKLYDVTPPGVSYNVIHIDESGALVLQGVSEVGAGVNSLQNNLVSSPLFTNVTLQYATKRKVFKGELTDFKITCQIIK